jgi:hypothetical protein
VSSDESELIIWCVQLANIDLDKSDKFAKFGLPFSSPSAKLQVYSQMKDHHTVSQTMVSNFGSYRHKSSCMRNGSVFITTTTTSSFAVPFVEGIYGYRPQTNLVSRAYNVAASLCLQCMVHRILFLMIHIL